LKTKEKFLATRKSEVTVLTLLLKNLEHCINTTWISIFFTHDSQK